MDHFLFKSWTLILCGAMLIAIGGVLTTLGWNNLNARSQRRHIIHTLGREWEINDRLLREALFAAKDETVLASRQLYPRFKSSAMDNALMSGQFNGRRAADRLLLRSVADYETTIADTNARLDVSDNFMLSCKDLSAIANHRKHVIQSNGFRGFRKEHDKFRDFLSKHYLWAAPEELFK